MLKRLPLLIKAKLSSLLDRAEDPAEILDYGYERQVEQLYGMRRDVADLVTAKKRVAQQRDRRQRQFLQLQDSARRALELGREDLARQALERKRVVGLELVTLGQQVSDLERRQAEMIAHGRAARARVEQYRYRKEVVKAQYAAAKARVTISDAISVRSSQLREVGTALERTREKADDLHVRAGAIEELERAGTFTAVGADEDDIDRQLRELSSGGSIDAEISRMKLELGHGQSGGPPR